jgi:hypothetical protein
VTRSVLAAALAVLAGLLFAFAVAAGDARSTLLDTDRWVEVSAPVVEQQAVLHELAGLLVAGVAARLACRGGVEALLVGLTPDRLRATLEAKVEQALASAKVAAAWRETNRSAHRSFVRAVALDRPPGEDRLLDVALLLDVVSARIAPTDHDAGGSRCARSANATQFVSGDALHEAARAARALHDHRQLPRQLVVGAVLLLVASLLLLRPLVSLAAAGVGAAAFGLAVHAGGPALIDHATSGLEPGAGAVTARALADAASAPALEHQYWIGIGGIAVLGIVAIAMVVRSIVRRGR